MEHICPSCGKDRRHGKGWNNNNWTKHLEACKKKQKGGLQQKTSTPSIATFFLRPSSSKPSDESSTSPVTFEEDVPLVTGEGPSLSSATQNKVEEVCFGGGELHGDNITGENKNDDQPLPMPSSASVSPVPVRQEGEGHFAAPSHDVSPRSDVPFVIEADPISLISPTLPNEIGALGSSEGEVESDRSAEVPVSVNDHQRLSVPPLPPASSTAAVPPVQPEKDAEAASNPAENPSVPVSSDLLEPIAGRAFPNDPALFCTAKGLKSTEASYLKKLGPCQPSADQLPQRKFPANKNGRHFHAAYYTKRLPDGTQVKRDWISYSPSLDKVYCIDCMLYGKGAEKAWTSDGFNTWTKMYLRVVQHELSETHIKASIQAKIQESCHAVIPSLEEGRKRTVEFNRGIVKHLVDCVLYLAKHCMALRGHREFQGFDFHGKFVDLVALLAKYSPQLDMYMTSLVNKEVKNSFMYWRRQDQLLSTIANYIKRVIVGEIKEAPFFSVSMDGTFDLSRKEQVVFVVRYVSGETGEVVERLLAIKQCTVGTGEQIFEIFKQVCMEQGLDWKSYLVGQSHDGASGMRGEESGLQTLIRAENPQAIYVWCHAHRLALVVNDVAECCLDAKNLFSNLEVAFNMICGSKKRADFFEKEQKLHYPKTRIRRLKRVSTTRWMSYEKALNVCLDRYTAFYNTIKHVSEDEKAERRVRSEAESLLKYFRSEVFFLTAFFFKKLFAHLEPLNLVFQRIDVDLMAAAELLTSKEKEVASLRSETELQNIKVDYLQFIEESGITDVTPLPATRSRKRKQMSDELAPDEPQSDPYERYRTNTYYFCLDRVLAKFTDRFRNSNRELVELMKDMSLLTESKIEAIRRSPPSLPSDAFVAFTDIYHGFLDLPKLVKEYRTFVQCYAEFEQTLHLPKILHPARNEDLLGPLESDDADDSHKTGQEGEEDDVELVALSDMDEAGETSEEPHHAESEANAQHSILRVYRVFNAKGLKTIFPQIYLCLKIALTIPLSSATDERKLSVLKLVKTRLRTSVLGGRLDALMQIACEKDIAIDYEVIIDEFASLSPLLKKMLII